MSFRLSRMRLGFLGFIPILLYTIGPILCVLLCALIANALGCQVDEGGTHPCNCLGVDIGGPLAALGVMGWLALVTIPTGVIAMVVYLVAALVLRLTTKSGPADDQA